MQQLAREKQLLLLRQKEAAMRRQQLRAWQEEWQKAKKTAMEQRTKEQIPKMETFICVLFLSLACEFGAVPPGVLGNRGLLHQVVHDQVLELVHV